NTLHALTLRLAMLRAQGSLTPDQVENVHTLQRLADDAAVVIGRVQDFAHQRHDKPGQIDDLRGVVEQAGEMVAPEIVERSALTSRPIQIELDVPALPPVSGAAADVLHVLVNLIINARDAMPLGGSIAIGARRGRGRVEITVADDGTGVAPE